MLTKIDIAPCTLAGVSVAGVYTALHVPQLDALFDAGVTPRSFAGAGHLFLSHGHADHVGALPSLIGVRGLSGQPAPRTFVPAEIEPQLREGVAAFSSMQRRELELPVQAVRPGDQFPLSGNLHVRVFRTLHSVPSVGYLLFRKVQKIRPAFRELPPREIAARRREDARKKCHIHLDEILERAGRFQNQHLVLMHFSQIYRPEDVHRIIKSRVGGELSGRVKVFAPLSGPWPG